jgi:hypothetical protein
MARRQVVVMSDLTNLSYQYQRRAEFAQQINDAVLKLKRQATVDSPCSLTDTVEFLVPAIDYLVRRLNDDRPEGEKLVPEEVVHDLSTHATDADPYFKEDLAETLKALQHTSISADHWQTLEQLCTVADRAASASYRRLRRR